ncbi:MAG: VOC family protein [Deltaproteobacteria bacterium]|nr:VOC family protein [Deltaproteobacteria bacterium]MBW1931010.1 VOC family protein [Deltaproteobacteria bacterium]
MSEPYVDHIGIIVHDLDEALRLFENLFDLKPANVLDMEEVGLRIATLKAANVDLELIQYMDQREGIARRTMGDRKGINHISFRVKDVSASLEQFQQKGAQVLEGFPRQGSHGVVAFFRADSTAQILLEICEHKG